MLGRFSRAISRIASGLLAATLGFGASLLHEALGPFEREEPRAFELEEPELLREFGLEEHEEARYAAPDGRSVIVRAMQFYDDTGAVAAYAWLKPPDATPVERGERAVEAGDYTLIQFANYVVSLRGDHPDEEDIEIALAYLPRPKPTADPPVFQYVPGDLLVPGTGRLILGPVSLATLAPDLAPSVVGFHFGTEGYYGRFLSPDGEMEMVIWSYPSNPIAREQVQAFHEVDAVVAKQDGPLIAVALNPESADDAQLLLARVRYRAEVTQHVEEAKRYDNLRNIILDTFILCGLLATLMILGGVLVAGTRRLAGRVAPDSIVAPPEGSGMQRLGIDGLGSGSRRNIN
ncbi:MAG: hypothetical protein OXN89_27130 [Bryobacterales bacterium]|nr:hypothetical protein [Bryobacterales bacterium]